MFLKGPENILLDGIDLLLDALLLCLLLFPPQAHHLHEFGALPELSVVVGDGVELTFYATIAKRK